MTVHIYSPCWNEEMMLPYYFRHYDSIVDQYYIFDDGSNDATLEILRAHPKVEIMQLERNPDSFIASEIAFDNSAWKQSRGKADWVIICSIDEHFHHPNLRDYLQQCRLKGITYIPSEGWHMISDDFPETDQWLCDVITRGARWDIYDKSCIFNPNRIKETNYGPGRHHAQPTGRVIAPRVCEVKLLHYDYLSLDKVIKRSAELDGRLGKKDREKEWSVHYRWDLPAEFAKWSAQASEVPLKEVGEPIRPQNLRKYQGLKAAKRKLTRILKREP